MHGCATKMDIVCTTGRPGAFSQTAERAGESFLKPCFLGPVRRVLRRSVEALRNATTHVWEIEEWTIRDEQQMKTAVDGLPGSPCSCSSQRSRQRSISSNLRRRGATNQLALNVLWFTEHLTIRKISRSKTCGTDFSMNTLLTFCAQTKSVLKCLVSL